MNVAENKELMRQVFDALAAGDARPFVDSLADDIRWTITGTTRWSRTYDGKQEVQTELLEPLGAQFADRYRTRTKRLIAEGDYVVVEFRGSVMTTGGLPYNNSYCYVCRLGDGKVRELTEYWDTVLAAAVLDAPERAPRGEHDRVSGVAEQSPT
jgi:ketosteroid isomerase-like protein